MKQHTLSALVVTTVAVGFAAAFGVGAAIPDSGGVFHACVAKSSGAVRLVDGSCKSGESAVAWNEAGPAGPRGETGAAGATGERGPSDAFIARNDGPVQVASWPGTTTVVELELPAGVYAVFGKVVAVNPSTGVDYKGAAMTCRLSTGEYSGTALDGNEAFVVSVQDLLTLEAPGTVAMSCDKSYPDDETHSGTARMAKITAIQVAALHG